MTLIAIKKLHPDPRNANICSDDTLQKLKAHMDRNQFCPTLLVRPHPKKTGHFMIVDGHHRKQVAETLGWSEVECQVKALSDEEAGLLLLTLNRLRGTDIPRKRAELMNALLPSLGLQELASLLPETSAEIEGLLALLKQDEEQLEKALKAQIEAERKTLPVPIGFMIPADDVPIVQEALAQYQAKAQADQGQALVAICRDILAHEQA